MGVGARSIGLAGRRRWAMGIAFFLALCALPLDALAQEAREWSGTSAVGIEIRDQKRKRVEGAEVQMRYAELDPWDGPAPYRTDSSGRMVISDLARGSWRVDVSKPGHASYLLVIRIEPGRKAEIIGGPIRDGAEAAMRISFFNVEGIPTLSRKGKSRVREKPKVIAAKPAEPKRVKPEPAPAKPKVLSAEPAEPKSEPPPEPAPAPSPLPPPRPEPPKPEPEAGLEAPPAAEPEPVISEPPTAAVPAREFAEPPMPEPQQAPIETPAPPAFDPPPPPVREPAPAAVPPPAPPPPRPAPVPEPARPTVPGPTDVGQEGPVGVAPPPSGGGVLRSPDDGSCPECRVGEWALSVEGVAAVNPSKAPCPPGMGERMIEIVELLNQESAPAGASYQGSLFDFAAGTAAPVGSAETRGRIAELLRPPVEKEEDEGETAPACVGVAVLLAPGASYHGYAVEARDAYADRTCVAGRGCEIGLARWLNHPQIRRTELGTLIFGVFENRSAKRERVGRLIVYFSPAGE